MKPINWKELEYVVKEWQALIGAQVQRADQPAEDVVYLTLYGRGQTVMLLFSAHDDACRAHTASSRPTNPPSPHGFVGLLRGRIVPSRLEFVRQTPKDRVVTLGFVVREEDALRRYSLVAELTGRHANLFLLNENDVVLAGLRPGRGEERPNTPGQPYQAVVSPSTPPNVQPRFATGPFSGEPEPFPINAEAERVFIEEESRFLLDLERTRVERWLRNQRGKQERTHQKLLEKQRDWEQAPLYRKYGDLLQIHFSRLERGQENIEVEDLFDGGLLTIPLLPELSPQKNVERHYTRYRKALRGREETEARLLSTEDELDRLDRLAELAAEAQTVEDMQAVARKAGMIQRKQEQRKRKSQEELRALPYRVFVSSTGKTIWVGKGAKENDRLSFGLSKGQDRWLHAHEAAGSHVLIRMGKQEKDDETTLREAAQLALHYSKARGEGEVMLSHARFLRKPKNAPPGLVYVTEFKVLTLRKDDATIRRLMADSRKIWDGEPPAD